ncbi:MAG: oligopeptide/dipeptide ABC transporter ATP-binding protein [Pseudomonadota bacterium]
MTDTLVEVRGLTRRFDVSKPWLNRVIEREERRILTAASDVTFDIGRGETFALVGESGSGKSTIAKMMVGLLPPTSGSISIDGTDLWAASADRQRELRKQFQMIFQDPYASLNPRWRVADIVAEPIRTFDIMAGREVGQRVAELLSLVGLDPKDGTKYPHEFSGGQRQRIAIARALSSNPEFIVCDEPTSALDVSVQAQILNLMRDLQDRLGLTYLIISHDLGVVRHMATRIGVLYLGHLYEEAPAAELFANPKHPYTRMLLAAIPKLEAVDQVAREPIAGEIPNPIDPPSGCTFHPRCPLAFERCPREDPALLPAGGGRVACHAVQEGRAAEAA